MPAWSIAAASSFLLQLVADRLAVLARGGAGAAAWVAAFSFVTWLAQDMALPADSVYHEVIGDIDGDDEEDEGVRSPTLGRLRHSLDQAHAQSCLEAGFDAIEVVRDELALHAGPQRPTSTSRSGYDDHERIESLDEARRDRSCVDARWRSGLATLAWPRPSRCVGRWWLPPPAGQ